MSLFASPLSIDEGLVVAAIGRAESGTSGEIRVVISRKNIADPISAAQEQFERLGMTRTAARNGVLIFLAPRSRTFAVIGDRGVHEKCSDLFWQELAAAMTTRFRTGDFTAGLVLGIERAGALLAQHFPRGDDDHNELPDGIAKAD